ncbi:MAG: TetR/AcrR family transcriptional regulator [Oscillochloris sp.]|nr:TetR/AcrR family transcriptional regulator [Oscillochloris sp.]
MNSEAETATERGPGRPREPEIDQRILDAALHLMAQGGYVRMSMDQVATEAGVTKPTIYRRYPNKNRLALAAIVAFCDKNPPVYSGDTCDDLIAQMRQLQQALGRPHGMSMLGTMLAEEHETPELLANFREYLVFPRRHAIAGILERAQARGELRAGVDLELSANMLVGAYYAQYLSGMPFSADWPERVVDAALAGIKA